MNTGLRFAAIDIGSNAIRLLFARIFENGNNKPFLIKESLIRMPLRLGEDVFIKHYEVGELADSAEKNISEAKEVSAGYSPPKELHHFHKMLLRLRDIEAIVIAGINGNTAGGGCEFSLGCDLRIMSEGPYAIGLPETSVGILPGGGGTQRLARLIGSSRALDLILHARLLSPQEAFEFGLINKLVPHERFREELMTYCSDLASRAPIALRQVKKIIHKGLDKTLEE